VVANAVLDQHHTIPGGGLKEKWAGNSALASTDEEPGPLGGGGVGGPSEATVGQSTRSQEEESATTGPELAVGRLCVLMSVELLVVDAAIAQLDKAGDALRPAKLGGCSTFVGGPAPEP